MPIWSSFSPDCGSCVESVVTGRKTRPVETSPASQRIMAEPDAEVFALRLRLQRALSDHADLYQQLELGKRESMLASAEIEGLKSYHFKETHELQDQLLSQRSVVSKLTLRLQEALQGGHQATMLHDEMTTMRQSHGISMKRLQSQVSRQDAELKAVQSERDALAAELESMRAELNSAASLAEHHNGQQHLHEGNAQQAHAAQLRELQAAHEEQVSSIQQAAQQSQADLQAAHAVESRIMQEAHAADMKQLQELREALPQAISQASSEARHPQDLSTSEIDALLAERGEVAVSCEELNELRVLAANGADSAELAQETADLIALLHQARSSNLTLRKERDRLRHKMDMFKKTLSSELLTMQLRGSNDSDSM
ncbi:hypothetical protein WJX82_007551 [Trebouxia sp. C0006]